MKNVLHILTRPDDSLALTIIGAQEVDPELRVRVVDLTWPEPDYRALLDEIFAAESVSVW